MLLLRFAFFNNMILLRFGLLILSFIQWDLSFVEWKMTPSWPCLEKTFLYNCWCLRQSVHSISSAGFACDLCWHGDEVVWQWDLYPGAPLTYFNDGGGGGGVRQRFIFYTQNSHNFKICLPKKITTFLAYPKNPLVLYPQPKNISLFFYRPKKIMAYFIDPKESLWAKISDPKKSLGPPPVIKICKWGPWGSLLGCGCRSSNAFSL